MLIEIIATKKFEKELIKIKDVKQLIIIKKMKEKVVNKGKEAIKFLGAVECYLIGEIKSKRPPYRLYVIVNQNSNKFYLIGWEHKNKQQQVIEKIKTKLKLAMKTGLDSIF